MACAILIPWSGIEPLPSAVEAQNLNHWTSRQVCQQFIHSVKLKVCTLWSPSPHFPTLTPGNHHSPFCFYMYNGIAFNRTISVRKTWIRDCYFMSLVSFLNSSLNVWEMMWWESSLCSVPSRSPKPQSKSWEIYQTDFNSGTFYKMPNCYPTKLSRPPRTREVLENVTDQSSLRRNDWPVTCYLYSLCGILGEKKNAWFRKN